MTGSKCTIARDPADLMHSVNSRYRTSAFLAAMPSWLLTFVPKALGLLGLPWSSALPLAPGKCALLGVKRCKVHFSIGLDLAALMTV